MTTEISGKIFRSVFDLRPGELARVLLLAAPLFFAMATFWAIKPVKRGMFLGWHETHQLALGGTNLTGAETEQLAKVANVLVAWVLMVLLTGAGNRLRRQQMLIGLCSVAICAFFGFALWSRQPDGVMVWLFYIFGDMFNTVAIVLFWAFVNDTVSAPEARRLYGPIGLGGVLGGLFGASVVRLGITDLGRETLLYLCMIPIALIALCGWLALKRIGGADEAALSPAECAQDCSSGEAWQLLRSSKYLMAIAVMVTCYEIASGIVDFQFSSTVERMITEPLMRDEYFGAIGQIQSLAAICVQLLLTGFLMRRFGVGTALLVLPSVMMLGAVGLLLAPTLTLVTALSVSDNSMSYSINQSARETLYVPMNSGEKNAAKALIDVFVQRCAKVIGVLLNLGLAMPGALTGGVAQLRWLSLASLLVLAAWIGVVRFAGRRFDRMVSAESSEKRLNLELEPAAQRL
jgi:AAA family ATP:ADP antiporter